MNIITEIRYFVLDRVHIHTRKVRFFLTQIRCWTLKMFVWLIFVPLVLLINSFKFRSTFSHGRPSQQLLSSYFTYLWDRCFANLKSRLRAFFGVFLYHSFIIFKLLTNRYKSSAVAETGDRGHNTHGPKEGDVCPFRGGT